MSSVLIAKKMLLVAMALWATSCNGFLKPKEEPRFAHPEWVYPSVIYEMNLRQQHVEATFKAAEERLAFLSDLKTDILCLSPIHPVGRKGRKGRLGCPYAVRDYYAVASELGTMDDFRHFLEAAHEEGFRVIIDFVASHTASDAVCMEQKPKEWYCLRNGKPMGEKGREDYALLNYELPEVQEAMLGVLKFWVREGVDGFRCHRASEVPDGFWKRAIRETKGINPDLYWLADGDDNRFYACGFDAVYAQEAYRLMNDVAAGRKSALDFRRYIERLQQDTLRTACRVTFTSNMRENALSGTEFERMGKAARIMAALSYVLPQCQPMISTGQEIGHRKRFPLYDRQPVTEWNPTLETNFYRRMNHVRHKNSSIWTGERGGELEFVEGTHPDVLAFRRYVNFNDALCVLNLSDEAHYFVTTVDLDDWWLEASLGDNVRIYPGEVWSLAPWEYRIYFNPHCRRYRD